MESISASKASTLSHILYSLPRPLPCKSRGQLHDRKATPKTEFYFSTFPVFFFYQNTALLKWVRINMEDVPEIFDETISFRSRVEKRAYNFVFPGLN